MENLENNTEINKIEMEKQINQEDKNVLDSETVQIREEKETVKKNEISEKEIKQNDYVEICNNGKTDSNEKKKEKIPDNIWVKGKSEKFKQIIGIALEYESLKEKQKELKKLNKALTEKCKEQDKTIEELRSLYEKRGEEINELKEKVEHRDEVIGIIKADKTESAQEYKNAISGLLKVYYRDFIELKGMEKTADVGEALVDTLEWVFSTLKKNGINVDE